MGPDELYKSLAHLVETFPTLAYGQPLSAEEWKWLGRCHALVGITTNQATAIQFQLASDRLGSMYGHESAASEIRGALYRALAAAELKVSPGVQGAFIQTGASFDALGAVGKILRQAKRDLLVVDPYLDARFLTDFALMADEGVAIRLLADKQSLYPSLKPAAERWAEQNGALRPLEVRVAPARTLHDRLLIADGSAAFAVSQSFKDLAARSPATIMPAEPAITSLKVASYGDLWAAATPLI